MKKLIVLTIAVCLLLAGCVRVDIDARLSDTNEVSLTYDISVDESLVGAEDAEEAGDAIESLARHFTRMGYEVETDGLAVRATYREECGSREDAAAAFGALMKNEYYSPFTQAGFEYDLGETSAYRFSGVIDTKSIVDMEGIAEIPSAVISAEELPQGVIGTVTVSLPSDSGAGTATADITTDDIAVIDVSSIYSTDSDMRESVQSQEGFAGILLIAVGAVSAALIVALIVSLRRKPDKKSN